MMNITMRTSAALALVITLTAAVVGRSSTDLSEDARSDVFELAAQPVEDTSEPANTVDITVRGMEFMAPDEISSGWTTFRLDNTSGMIHFAVVERLPDGITLADQQSEVAPVFQEGMDLLNEGKVDEAMAAFGNLPEWFGQVVFKGGPGLIAPRGTAETTVYLEPGTYLLECYVKTDRIFHSYSPSSDRPVMVHEITVTDERSDAPEPDPTLDLTISSERGIEIDGDITPARHTVAVHFESQHVHEHFLGHDVHLVRLEDDTNLDEVATWMDWTQARGLETPAPATFLGGTQEMPTGETAYFSVLLEPGRYAWIAEVPNPAEKNMLKTFTVPSDPTAER